MVLVHTARHEGEVRGFVRIVGLSQVGYHHSEGVDGMANQKSITKTGLNHVIFKVRVRKVCLLSISHHIPV